MTQHSSQIPESAFRRDTPETIDYDTRRSNDKIHNASGRSVKTSHQRRQSHRRPGTMTGRSAGHRLHFDNVQSFWHRLSRRTIILISVIAFVVIAVIVGLAAGLSSRSATQNLPLPSGHGGPYTGDLTYYAPGLGACGVSSSGSDAIVAVSHILYDAVQSGSNPNSNPLCGKMLRVRRNSISVDLTVVDRCTGCQPTDLDVTIDTFARLANVDEGRVTMSWAWLQQVSKDNTSLRM